MAMSTKQISAFKASTGGQAPADLLLVVSMTLAVIYLLWAAWIAYAQFKAWQTGKGDFYDLIFTVARAAVVAMVIGFTLN
ncbi:MAG: TIGR03758 family integrating conjugative element protein [Methylococcaceae bacterium]